MSLVGCTSAVALDLSSLPPTCQETVDTLKGDKGRFTQLGGAMVRARKGKDTGAFCMSARQIVVLIKEESDRIDACVGELAGASTPQGLADQFLRLKATYRQMLDAAKEAKNDRFQCGLADQ